MGEAFMSTEDQYGPALKRARRAYVNVDESTLWGDDGPLAVAYRRKAQASAALAQAEEMSRLADEQRTANLLEFCKVFAGSIEKIDDHSVRDVIYGRLGITERSTTSWGGSS